MEINEHGILPEKKSTMRGSWLKLFLIGLITYFLGVVVLAVTSNTNLFPGVVLLGNFLIPVTYVSFFYEKRRMSKVRLIDTAASFFYGGFLGTFAAAMLEPIFIRTLSVKAAIIIGIIEEMAKILGVLMILRYRRYDLALDGIILGAAAGMGFAALESSGYAFNTFLRSGGSLSLTVYITLLRGIFSPFGHGTWTAILAGILVSERTDKNLKFNSKVIGAYFIVVVLHGLWDALPFLISPFISSTSAVIIGELAIGLSGIIILSVLWHFAKHQARLRANM